MLLCGTFPCDSIIFYITFLYFLGFVDNNKKICYTYRIHKKE